MARRCRHLEIWCWLLSVRANVHVPSICKSGVARPHCRRRKRQRGQHVGPVGLCPGLHLVLKVSANM